MLIECISKLFSTTPLIVIFCRGDIFNLSGFGDLYVVANSLLIRAIRWGVAPRRGLGGGIMINYHALLCGTAWDVNLCSKKVKLKTIFLHGSEGLDLILVTNDLYILCKRKIYVGHQDLRGTFF